MTRVIFKWLLLSQPEVFEIFTVATGQGLTSNMRNTHGGVKHVQHPSVSPPSLPLSLRNAWRRRLQEAISPSPGLQQLFSPFVSILQTWAIMCPCGSPDRRTHTYTQPQSSWTSFPWPGGDAKWKGKRQNLKKSTSSLRRNTVIVPWTLLGDCHCFGKPHDSLTPLSPSVFEGTCRGAGWAWEAVLWEQPHERSFQEPPPVEGVVLMPPKSSGPARVSLQIPSRKPGVAGRAGSRRVKQHWLHHWPGFIYPPQCSVRIKAAALWQWKERKSYPRREKLQRECSSSFTSMMSVQYPTPMTSTNTKYWCFACSWTQSHAWLPASPQKQTHQAW